MQHYKENIDLPDLPEDLLIPISEIQKLECETPDIADVFGVYVPNPEQLKIFNRYAENNDLKKIFGGIPNLRYQVVSADLPIHTDRCDEKWKYLYLYEVGGDQVITEWFDDDQVVESVNLQPLTWSKIDVQTPHRVRGIEHPRCFFVIRSLIPLDRAPTLYERFIFYSKIKARTLKYYIIYYKVRIKMFWKSVTYRR